ncbi:MAG: hypothetical protein ABIR18_04575 [Chitinophagaceae bacterium]
MGPHDYYDSYSAIVVQGSAYIRAGEKIDITAGVGAFSKAAMPVITANGKLVLISYDGAEHYTFKASSQPGKHYVPVRIECIDEIGKKQIIERNVKYTVVAY